MADTLLRRFGLGQPDFAGYPGPGRFTAPFSPVDYRQALASRRGRSPLSFVINVPDGVARRGRLPAYLASLHADIGQQLAPLGAPLAAQALRLHGVQSAQLSDKALSGLLHALGEWLPFAGQRWRIEASACLLAPERLASLRGFGFGHLALQVDVAPERHLLAAREAGFETISAVLPGGEVAAFLLPAVMAAGADRVRLEVPHTLEALPAWQCATERLFAAGYVNLGAHWFVRADDPLAVAQGQGRLFLDTHGFSSSAPGDWLAFGADAVGSLGAACFQNTADPDDYARRVAQGVPAVVRGLQLDLDDLVRRSVISMLLCNGALSLQALGQAFPIPLPAYFEREIAALQPFVDAGAVAADGDWIRATEAGRLLLPALCQLFDR